jgi:HEPN domain-containing protein
VDRNQRKALAEEWLEDARVLLNAKRWSAAYYLSGYVVECALKACLLKHLGESGAIFGDSKHLKRLADCWTHDLEVLVGLAGLDAMFGQARGANAALETNGGVVKDLKETSRYESRPEAEALAMYEAVTHDPDGVYPWIRAHW